MNRKIILNNEKITCAKPLICVPLVGENVKKVKNEILLAQKYPCDVLEWRVDFFNENILDVLEKIANLIKPQKLLLTFRTKAQGGEKNIDDYAGFIKEIISSRLVDFIDIELVSGDKEVKALTEFAKKNGVISVVSEHFFSHTPSDEEIQNIYEKMQSLGGEIPKIAVMPQDFTDVTRFMSTVYKVSKENSPIIGISMSGMGAISRICSKHMGSCLSFAVSDKASAPGQLPSTLVSEIMENI